MREKGARTIELTGSETPANERADIDQAAGPFDIAVVSLFPEMIEAAASVGICGRAAKAGLLRLTTVNPRDFAEGPHRMVDDRPYGGGPGMVMMVEPLREAIADARAQLPKAEVVYLSPQGERLAQRHMRQWAADSELVLICGRYEGIDERVIELDIDREVSLGDFVLSGGEIAALAVIDGVSRLVPGVLGCGESAAQDSFADGLLDCPHYTRPETVAGLKVPDVLLSGHHENIARWRLMQSLGRTKDRRPDLLAARELTDEEQRLLDEYVRERENDS